MSNDDAIKAAHEEETEYYVGVDPGCAGEEAVSFVRIRESEGKVIEVYSVYFDASELEDRRSRRLYLALRAQLGQWLRQAYRTCGVIGQWLDYRR